MTGGLDALFPTLRHKKLRLLQIITGSGGLGITSFRWFVNLFSIHVKSKLASEHSPDSHNQTAVFPARFQDGFYIQLHLHQSQMLGRL